MDNDKTKTLQTPRYTRVKGTQFPGWQRKRQPLNEKQAKRMRRAYKRVLATLSACDENTALANKMINAYVNAYGMLTSGKLKGRHQARLNSMGVTAFVRVVQP